MIARSCGFSKGAPLGNALAVNVGEFLLVVFHRRHSAFLNRNSELNETLNILGNVCVYLIDPPHLLLTFTIHLY